MVQLVSSQQIVGGQTRFRGIKRTGVITVRFSLTTVRATEGCNNVQMAVDSQHTRIIANDVTHDPGDRDGGSPMALQAQAILSCPYDAVADVGYYHGEEVKTCLAAGITSYVTHPITSANKKLGLFNQGDCIYDGATATDQCPAGERLT